MNIFTIVWILWFLSEILISRLFRSKTRNSDSPDKNSLKVIWITINISIFAGVLSIYYFPSPIIESDSIKYFGLLIIICGIIIRFIAIRTLGKFFTVDLAMAHDHLLIKKGLYKFIRHPSYTGSLMSFFGFGLSLNNWISLLVIFIPVFIAFIYRMNIEEKLLIAQIGQEYQVYISQTKRLIPKIY